MSQHSVLSDGSEKTRRQPRGPSDIGSVFDELHAAKKLEGADPLKKLKNALWTSVVRVERGSIERIAACSLYDAVQNALTNIDVLDVDEYEQVEILFDAAAFEKPPDGAALSDFRLPKENLEGFV